MPGGGQTLKYLVPQSLGAHGCRHTGQGSFSTPLRRTHGRASGPLVVGGKDIGVDSPQHIFLLNYIALIWTDSSMPGDSCHPVHQSGWAKLLPEQP